MFLLEYERDGMTFEESRAVVVLPLKGSNGARSKKVNFFNSILQLGTISSLLMIRTDKSRIIFTDLTTSMLP